MLLFLKATCLLTSFGIIKLSVLNRLSKSPFRHLVGLFGQNSMTVNLGTWPSCIIK